MGEGGGWTSDRLRQGGTEETYERGNKDRGYSHKHIGEGIKINTYN